MANTNEGTGAVQTPKTKKTVSKREFFDAEKSTKDVGIEDAAGARYTLLDSSGDAVRAFDYTFGADSNADRLYALFGFHTKVGNVANTTLNDATSPGTPEEAADEVASFIDGVAEGTWAERGRGGVGEKIDLDVLSEAIFQWGITYEKWTAENTEKKAAVRAKLDSDKKFKMQMWRNSDSAADIRRNYNRILGRAMVETSDLLDSIG